MRKFFSIPQLMPSALCLLAGIALLITPLRFTGALLIGLAAVLLLWAALKGRKTVRRILAVLLIIGFLVFSAAQIQVVRYAFREDDAPVSAVIVLGAGVYGARPSLSLQVRLEAALDYIQDKPDIPVVVSGGQGPGEDISEAQCMADWLIAHGVDETRIIQENQSTNTKENLAFSRAKLQEAGIDTDGHIAVVSADYHLYRARLYWGSDGMVPVAGCMPARWWPITVNQFVREAFGVVYLRVFGV